MTVDPANLSIAELRERYVSGDEPVSGQLLRKLQRDPRQGVRDIHRILRQRKEAERQERDRLEALLHFERVLWRTGVERIAGVDEAGVGPLAGPVVAAAVVFPPDTEIPGMDDSKRLDLETRERLEAVIRKRAVGVAVGVAEVDEIDEINIYQAALLAMRRAVEGLPEPPQHVLVDAREIPDLPMPQNPFKKGDGINFTIAAASIVAKTHRDRWMEELDRRHPGYGFANHKGYATEEHRRAIEEMGCCPVHRSSFEVLRELTGGYSDLFYELRDRLDASEGRKALRSFETALNEARDDLEEPEYKKLRLVLGRRWKVV